ncbi:MAG: hypothetical protein ACTSQN_04490 [Candidatus Heimdallarchaeota archaeon]
MNKKGKLILITTMVSLLLFASNYTASQGIVGSWDVGSYETFTEQTYERLYQKYIPDNFETTEINEQLIVSKVNITSINNVTGQVFYDIFTPGTITPFSDYYFMSNLVGDYATLFSLFDFDYRYDEDRNQTVLYGFDIDLFLQFYVEANWTIFNNHFDTIFNGSTIIDTVTDPYNGSITYEITFGDFLANCKSFSINGQSTLAAAKQTFTSSNTGLSIKFDNGGVRHRRLWNFTAGHFNYYVYDTYKIENNLKFDSGGILKEYVDRSVIGETIGDIYSEVEVKTAFYSGVQELPAITEESSLGYILVIPAIATIAVLVKWSRKRKN